MWKHIVEPDRPPMAMWRMRITRWMTKATDTHLEHVIIVTFLLHQWLQDYASKLRHSYTPRPHYSCHILKKLEHFDRFYKILKYQIKWKSVQCVITYRQTGRQT